MNFNQFGMTDSIVSGAEDAEVHIMSIFIVMLHVLSVWGGLNYFFCFHFYARFGTLLKGMGKSFLLSKDEPLTPNIDGVMTL